MNITELAKKIAIENKLPKAEKYDMELRHDGMLELIGLVPDPTLDMNEFRGREMLFPKRWLTLEVLAPETEVNV
jgi:hypothetical protein